MCNQCKVRLCASVLLLLFTCDVRGFNVDTEGFVKHSGEPGSMFGFSVAEHKERGSNWLLIGAPEAQTPQPGVKRGGAVYRCDITRDDYCQQIPFDRTGNNNNSEYSQLDSKSYQWFGATVRSSGEDGVIVACAPRYVWYSTQLNRRDPVGTCYVAKNQMTDFAEFSPCRTRNWGYHRQGSCQAGLGASISKDGKRLFIGGVGSWYWQGQIFSQNLYSRPDVISSNEGPAADDDSYLGYSVASGDFSGGGAGQNDVAVGMPRGAGLLGKIVLYTWNLTNMQNITGEQLGAYFGYSLASVDMDGDKLDDLVIGAPLYTDLSNNEGDYETGRIYVVYQGQGEQKFRSMNTRDGVNSKARFGLALASLGDINKDGYGDIAVGAPYDGPQERGAVYIYHGSATGIREKPSQVIQTSDLGLPLTTFGFSLSGGVDMDENQYPDLIVGAYESDTAVFLKARPVVKMMSSVSFLSEQKQVVLEETNCTLKDGTRVACLSLKMCLEYSGLGVDQRLDFDVQLILDSKKQKSPRMALLSLEGHSVHNQTITLDKGLQKCQEVFVYIKPGIRDKLTALEAEMRYSLRPGPSQGSRRRYQRSLTPVLDLNEPLTQKDSVVIQKNCGKDNVCIPNLRINATPNVKRYLLGSGERLSVDVVVINEGEDAFESVFDMRVPPGINYVNIERLDTERDVLVQCSAPSFINNHTLHCDIGNPLPKEKTVHFKVLLQPFHKPGMKARYEFDMSVNSTNPENKTSSDDNSQHLVVHIWVETDLILQGSSHPAMVHYNTSLYSEDNITEETDIGPQVVHIYSIRNKGPSDIVEAEVHFLWPTATLANDYLLYLLEEPELNGPIKCELPPNINPLKLTVERKRKSYLELGGIQSGLTSSGSFTSSSEGVLVEESGSASSSSSSSSSSRSFSSSGGNTVITSTSSLSVEERRRLEEAERRDKEEAASETGDGSIRHEQRVHMTGGGRQGSSSSSQSSSRGSSASYSGGTYRGGQEENTQTGGPGVRTESGSYGGRGSQGTLISERGRVEVSGAGLRPGGGNFETYSSFDNDRRTGGGYRASQEGGRTRPSNIEPGVGVAVNRGRYGSDERIYGSSQGGGYRETQTTNQNAGNRRVSEAESTMRRNQTNLYGVDARTNVPFNVGGVQNHTFSREESTSSNTTWNSETGGKPITRTSTSWRENEDGVVRTGESSNTYEATNVNIADMARGSYGARGSEDRGSYAAGSSVSRQYGSESDSSYRSGGSSGTQYRGSESYGRSGSGQSQSSYGSSSQDSRNRFEASAGSASSGSTSRYDPNAVLTPASSYGYDSRRTNSAAGSSSYGTSSGSASGSSQFDALAGIAAGPRDGVARTYTFDVANENEKSFGGHGSIAGVAAGSRDNARTYSYDNQGSRGSSGQYANSSGYSHQSSWSSDGGRPYISGTWSGDRDNVDSTGRNVGRDNVDYDSGSRRSGSSWRSSSSSSRESKHSSAQSARLREQPAVGDNVVEEEPGLQQRFKLYPRYRRQTSPEDGASLEDLHCGPVACTRIRCTVGPLSKDQEVWVAFRSRVWVKTLKKFAVHPEVQLSSLVAGRVTELPHIGAPDMSALHTHEVLTTVAARDSATRPDVVPLWVVVLSACAGALILMLLVYALYKCGFFKRNRPSSDVPEKQPLNRNGHYQSGDEAL
ncbi:integrin alpha-PS2 isoform X2 [Macrosteles quadrilineatus]|uniref:integrin alpha-PS2 isoform X2 n=1 Tax=Macrosteles quadrilineatus TaxID=74068 RepID=UPI0023E15916|nr:integrin alpha-PS2 isoform X2 [Macrosteles quadrilineatus]